MPIMHSKEGPFPGKGYGTIGEAARSFQLLVVMCNKCRRLTYYLTTDLVHVPDIGPKHFVHMPPFQCSRCKTKEYISTRLKTAFDTEYGNLEVRRLTGIKQVPVWRTTKLGDEL